MTKTRKIFVKKMKSGMIEDQILTCWGTKWTKMAKDAAETEEYFAGIRTFFSGIRTRKNGAYGSKALKHKKKRPKRRPLLYSASNLQF